VEFQRDQQTGALKVDSDSAAINGAPSPARQIEGSLGDPNDIRQTGLAEEPLRRASAWWQEPEMARLIERVKPLVGPESDKGRDYSQNRLNGAGTIVGHYRLVSVLGEGGMGIVYRAVHEHLGRTVALKMISTARRHDARTIERFRREITSLGALEHPNLVRATDAGEWEGVPYLVMELCDGVDLSTLVRTRGPLKPADAFEVVRQAALGLAYIHQNGRIHRDIKPSNLMLTRGGQVKILDLGLAAITAGSGNDVTRTNDCIGTFDYMAPEQLRAAKRIDIRADIYSLGCTLYKLLTGRTPSPGHQICPLLENAELTERLAVLVGEKALATMGQMLALDPEKRFLRPMEAAVAVEAYCNEAALSQLIAEPVAAAARIDLSEVDTEVSTTFTVPSRPPSRSKWSRAAVLVSLTAVVFLLAVAAVWYAITGFHPGDLDPADTPISANTATAPLLPLRKIYWPQSYAEPSMEFMDHGAKLRLATFRDFGMLQFDLPPSGNADISYRIRLLTAQGSAGIFFGYRREPLSKDVSGYRFDVIDLSMPKPTEMLTLKKSERWILLNGSRRQHGAGKIEGIRLNGSENHVAIRLRNKATESVVVNGVEVWPGSDTAVRQPGIAGIYIENTAAILNEFTIDGTPVTINSSLASR
jgi:hypothetical protein